MNHRCQFGTVIGAYVLFGRQHTSQESDLLIVHCDRSIYMTLKKHYLIFTKPCVWFDDQNCYVYVRLVHTVVLLGSSLGLCLLAFCQCYGCSKYLAAEAEILSMDPFLLPSLGWAGPPARRAAF